MKQKFKTMIPWVLLIIWCILIFSFSAKTADQSTKDSDKIIFSFVKKMDRSLYDKLSILVRKSAHFFLYFLLGVFSQFAFSTLKKIKHLYRLSFYFCALYAVSDEVHQFFVPGRSCQLADILLDSVAACCSILLCCHIIRRCQKHKQKQ